MTTKHIANNLEKVYFGGNWTASNLKDNLDGITLAMAKTKVKNFNTILTLTYHIHYYLKGTMDAINTGELTIRDKFSFDHPTLTTDEAWRDFQDNMWTEAKAFIKIVENLDDSILDTYLAEEKYGTYSRNLFGIIEHTHYHLGQIALLKKMVSTS